MGFQVLLLCSHSTCFHLKLSIHHHRTNKLRLSLYVEPRFSDVIRSDDMPQTDITSLLLRNLDPSQASAFMRILNYGLNDQKKPIRCTIGALQAQSLVTMTFNNFGNSSLEYDPGTLCLILGS